MQNKPNRRKSRAVAMELLYSGTVNVREAEISDEFLEEFLDLSDTTETIDPDYIRRVVHIAGEQDAFLKQTIRRFLKEWSLERISRVNLSILKIAASEIFFMQDIPERVSLNEAIELAKTYSDEESQSFINAVLDRMIKGLKDGSVTLPQEGALTKSEELVPGISLSEETSRPDVDSPQEVPEEMPKSAQPETGPERPEALPDAEEGPFDEETDPSSKTTA